ncbi:mechanosensitive ion channel family protein [Marivirga aurantiaca]|nr:mechanosensitive ion channel family protein [Marivirga aurantiaca]
MRLLLFILISFSSCISLYAQQESEAETDKLTYSLQTPKATVTTFLTYLQEENFHPSVAAKTLHPAFVKNKDEEKLIVQLKQIIDGTGIMIDLEELPQDPNYTDTSSNKQRLVLSAIELPDVYLEKHQGKWYFSSRTIERIPEMHQSVYPFGTDKLMNILPKLGHQKFLGLHAWQHISILILIILCILIHKLLTFIFDRLIYQLLNKRGYKRVARDYIIPVARPFSLAIVVGLLIIFVPVLQLPIFVNYYLILLLNAMVPLFGTMVVYKLIDIIGEYMMKVAEKTESTMDDQIVPIVKRVLKIFVLIVGFLFILSKLRFDITALLAGISIGGLAFALAAQDTIKNFFGSLMILFDKPFQIGDWITAGDIDGTVEEVGFRSTRVRTFRNSLITVPNGKLADMSVDNHGLRQYRRFYTTITITYDTPTHLIEAFTEGLKRIVEEHPKTRKDFYNIYFNNMSAYSLDIMFYIFLEVPTWGEELEHKENILLSIMKLAKNLGIQFAFPTQTLHMENFPGQPSLSPKYDEKDAVQSKIKSTFQNSNSDKS